MPDRRAEPCGADEGDVRAYDRADHLNCVVTDARTMLVFSIPRAELDALQAELKRLRREVERGVARAVIQSDPGSGDDAAMFTREELAEAWGIRE